MPVKSLKDKKDKPRKDPNAPKKPSGAYIFYCNAKRDEVKRKNPDFNVAQVGKALGELWKQETLEAKQPYYDLADKDKQRYARQIAE